MIAYAARTGTLRNLAALRGAGWRIMVSARGMVRSEGFAYAIDNGAWTAFLEWKNGKAASNFLDLAAFEKAVAKLGNGADFIVAPDIVEGGLDSLELSLSWVRRLRRRRQLRGVRLMIAVQDGMERGQMLGRIKRSIGPATGIFVGGSDLFKETTLALWVGIARPRGAQVHVGRVNTARRIRLCAAAGVDSLDGSSASRFAVTLPPLDFAIRQLDFEGYLSRAAA